MNLKKDSSLIFWTGESIILLEVIYFDFYLQKSLLDYNITLLSPFDFSNMFIIFNLFILVVLLI